MILKCRFVKRWQHVEYKPHGGCSQYEKHFWLIVRIRQQPSYNPLSECISNKEDSGERLILERDKPSDLLRFNNNIKLLLSFRKMFEDAFPSRRYCIISSSSSTSPTHSDYCYFRIVLMYYISGIFQDHCHKPCIIY